MFKYKQIILFEVGKTSVKYINEKLPLRRYFTWFCFLIFFILDVLFFHLPEFFFLFSTTNHRANFLTCGLKKKYFFRDW